MIDGYLLDHVALSRWVVEKFKRKLKTGRAYSKLIMHGFE
jgi:hypothetical protein